MDDEVQGEGGLRGGCQRSLVGGEYFTKNYMGKERFERNGTNCSSGWYEF